MEILFKNDWLQIGKENDSYEISYNSGDHINSIQKIEVSKEDAMLAQQSDRDAENVIIKYQNINMGLV